jgi:hypothetical protein
LALFLTLVGLWKENRLLLSMASVGILLPQALWCVDFAIESCGGHFTGMTTYMFDAERSLFLRGLSLFHGWFPFLLVYCMKKTGYSTRALWPWAGTAIAACLVSYFFIPGPGQATSPTPMNVNFVYGMSDTEAQTWLPAPAYLLAWMLALVAVVYVPTHFLLKKFFPIKAHV